MGKGTLSRSLYISPYVAGELLLETERLTAGGGHYVHGGSGDDVGLFDLFKPEKDDYKGLSKGLKFLKFEPDEAEKMYNVIGTAANMVAGIVSIVGAVGAVADLLNKLGVFGSSQSAEEKALEQIGQRVEQIYGYLGNADRKGLYVEARGWRVAVTKGRGELNNVQISRSPENLRTLIDRASDLDDAILAMLDAGSARISFQRSVYGYRPNSAHWIDAAASPFMRLANGETIGYRDPGQNLQSEIWDAGHYLDVLMRALTLRLAIAAAIEPAFRSTGYDRQKFSDIADGLTKFIQAWRGALIVANPAAGIGAGGQLHSSLYPKAPFGIVVGTIDPVTGIADFWPMWDGFTIIASRTRPFFAASGAWDETHAKEPDVALAAALALQASTVDRVVRACGLKHLAKLRDQLRLAASLPHGSDFVDLPNPTFRRIGSVTPADDSETMDLGKLKPFAPDPNKTYRAQRYYQEAEKTFRFRLARRADISRVQLGYTLRLGGQAIELTRFARGGSRQFPSAPITEEVSLRPRIYDCCQNRHLSAGDEDRFESHGSARNAHRLFLNERNGRARIRVTINFPPASSDEQDDYAAQVTVTVRNLDPQRYPDAFILDVAVMETVVGLDLRQVEVLADSMTLHVVPSYLVLANEFFEDMRATEEFLENTVNGINERYSMQELSPFPVDPDPAWRVRRSALEVQQRVAFLESALRERPEEIAVELERFKSPVVR